jgi:phosphoenolpyruvate phosphomutase
VVANPNGNVAGEGTPAVKLSALLTRSDAAVILGAHSALSAKIAEEVGADGFWISSFEVHTLARLPDADILGTQDVVSVVAQISDRVAGPILVDGNAGGGNAINTIRLVRELEKAGAGGVCIEDNPYPKRCSFYGGMQEELEQESTFCGKIQAAVEKRLDPDFVVVARTEALIKGFGLDVALERCKAYAAAGADAILIHHTQPDYGPVLEFAERWYRTESAPLVCVPTAYRTVTYDQLNDAGFKLIIFSHYGVRSVVKALQSTYGAIMQNRHLVDADEHVADMDEIFRLIYLDELKDNEARYVR